MSLQLSQQLILGLRVTLKFKECQKKSSQRIPFQGPHRFKLECLVIKDGVYGLQ